MILITGMVRVRRETSALPSSKGESGFIQKEPERREK